MVKVLGVIDFDEIGYCIVDLFKFEFLKGIGGFKDVFGKVV